MAAEILQTNLIEVCIIAFLAVMLVLALLAVVIALLTRLFPYRRPESEWLEEAIRQAAEQQFPGATITRIEPMN